MLSLLFTIFLLIIFFVAALILKGVASIVEVWNNVFGGGRKNVEQTRMSGTYAEEGPSTHGGGNSSSVIIDASTLGNTPRVDLGSVKDVDYEKED